MQNDARSFVWRLWSDQLTYEGEASQTLWTWEQRFVFPLQLIPNVHISHRHLLANWKTKAEWMKWCLDFKTARKTTLNCGIVLSVLSVCGKLWFKMDGLNFPVLVNYEWKMCRSRYFWLNTLIDGNKLECNGCNMSNGFHSRTLGCFCLWVVRWCWFYLNIRSWIGTICHASQSTRNVLCVHELRRRVSQLLLLTDVGVGNVRVFHRCCSTRGGRIRLVF